MRGWASKGSVPVPKVGDQLIHSRSYKSMTRRNKYTVKFKPGYGEIMFYVKVDLQYPISLF